MPKENMTISTPMRLRSIHLRRDSNIEILENIEWPESQAGGHVRALRLPRVCRLRVAESAPALHRPAVGERLFRRKLSSAELSSWRLACPVSGYHIMPGAH